MKLSFLFVLLFVCLFSIVIANEQQQLQVQEAAAVVVEEENDDKPLKAEGVVRATTLCPNDCSGHGRCLTSNQCSCITGWTGDDCSYADTPLSRGVAITDTVPYRTWHYYHYIVTDSSTPLVFSVNQTGPEAANSDCDIYIQFATYPTRASYSDRDISSDLVVFLEVPTPQTGAWFLGVYGFTTCQYTLVANQVSPCPDACSGHGTCQAGGTCLCSAGYIGANCNTPVASLTLNTPASGSVTEYEWKYYDLSFHSTAVGLVFSLHQTLATSDCDLYVRKGSIPTFWAFDAKNDATTQDSTVTIASPTAGDYYVGVWGFTACSFTLTATSQASCPNTCSGPAHGSCNGGTCSCLTGYSGQACEQATFNMANLVEYRGTLAANWWNYYSASVVSNQNIQLSVFTTGGDCDLYVKKDINPTGLSFDYRDVGVSQNYTLTIQNTASTANWKIGIYGFSSCSYTIRGTLSMACPNGCSSHGRCETTGRCTCDAGYSGDDCSSTRVALTSGVALTQSIASGSWQYYTVSNVQAAATVHLLELGGARGFLWLFISLNANPPTLSEFDMSATDTNSNNHNLIVPRLHPNDPTSFIVGVYGNPLIPAGHSVQYSISAFITPF